MHRASFRTSPAIRALKALGASLNDIRQVTADRNRGVSVANCCGSSSARRSARSSRRNATLAWIDGALEELHAEREVPIVLKQRAAIRVASVARTSQEL
jgi:hypothetical protein